SATGVSGVMEMLSKNNFLIYWDPAANTGEIGTSPLFEEAFHYDHAYKGISGHTLQGGKWSIYNRTDLIAEEARAKYRVANTIRNIQLTYKEVVPSSPTYYSKVNTHFGHMIINKMSQMDIRTFISTGRGRVHRWPLYQTNPGGVDKKVPGGYQEVSITGEGAY
ncbi:MAG: hypothetical protein ACPF9D_04625, partial [Owenweeksia sp.]